MDTFWIFIVIFGIIVSIGQKAEKKRTQTDENTIPEMDSEQDFERRIRELLEGKPTPTEQAEPKPATPEPIPTPVRKAKQTAKPSQYSSTHSHHKRKPQPATVTTKQGITGNPIKNGEIKRTEGQRGEIGQILDDFTIEKATIYAEILKPKYEEY